MSIKFTKLTKLSQFLVIATIASLFSIPAKAEMKSLPEAFEEAYFSRGKNAFEQSTILGQLDFLLGFTGFPDQHINADAEAVHNVYQQGIKKQAATGMRMLTRDLENPYNTSLRENPSYSAIK